MDTKVIQAFYGDGRGKTSAAVGQALENLPGWMEDHDHPVFKRKRAG